MPSNLASPRCKVLFDLQECLMKTVDTRTLHFEALELWSFSSLHELFLALPASRVAYIGQNLVSSFGKLLRDEFKTGSIARITSTSAASNQSKHSGVAPKRDWSADSPSPRPSAACQPAIINK